MKPIRRSLLKPLGCLLLVVLLAGILAMPREEYIADPMVVRCETVSLINEGTLAVPLQIVAQFAGDKGQYFVENENDNQWYSKYGILNSILYIPPLLLEKLCYGQLPYLSSDRVIFLNIFNLVVSLGTAAYLFFIVSRYTTSVSVVFIYVLSAFYCTYWWNYLRAQNSEVYQVFFMLGFYYHFTSMLRPPAGKQGRIEKGHRTQLLLAGIFLSALILVKTVYVALIPVALGLVVLYAVRGPGAGRGWREPIFSILWISIPLALAIAVLLLVNWHKFGSPFEAGYGQWQERGKPIFSGNIFTGIFGFIFDVQYSIFTHFPILIFAIFGFRSFLAKYPFEGIFFLAIFTVLFLVYSKFLEWQGGWGYGPRYMLTVLPLLSLPFIQTIEFLWRQRRKWWSVVCSAVISLSLLYSLSLQLNVNALPFFIYPRVCSLFVELHQQAAADYMADHQFGTINGQLLAFKNGAPFPALQMAAPHLDPTTYNNLRAQILQMSVSNYYFWPDIDPMASLQNSSSSFNP